VVERVIGNDEVGSSILPDGTRLPVAMPEDKPPSKQNPKQKSRPDLAARSAAALKANMARRKASDHGQKPPKKD
jgi:hypothetical protein